MSKRNSVLFVGDLYPTFGNVNTNGIRKIARKYTTIIANLEAVLTRRAPLGASAIHLRCDPLEARKMAVLGVRCVSLANNHALDCGEEGLLDSIDVLSKNKIITVGASKDRLDALEPAYIPMDDCELAIFGIFDGWVPKTSKCYISQCNDLEAIRRKIQKLTSTDVIPTAYIHWGVEYTKTPSIRQQSIASRLIKIGFKLVIGHHPHVVQSHEMIDGCPIYYSLGNFNMPTNLLQKEASIGMGVKMQGIASRHELIPFKINKVGSVKELQGSQLQMFNKMLASFNHVANHSNSEYQWRELYAPYYLNNHVNSFRKRFACYGLSQTRHFLQWMLSPDTIKWGLGLVLNKTR